MPITIRQATEDDWSIVRDVRLAALRDAPNAFGSSYEREIELDEERWRSRLRNPDGPTFLAFDDETAVGIDGVYLEAGLPQLVAMWVAPRARRLGVAAALTKSVIAWASARGAKEVQLGVAEGNDAAQRLYAKLGFEFTGRSEPLPSDPTRLFHEMAYRI